MKNLFTFHENSRKNPWRKQADYFKVDADKNFMALADGIDRDYVRKNKKYPLENYGDSIAKLFVETAYEIHEGFNFAKAGQMDEFLHEVNKAIYDFNEEHGFDYEAEDTPYWMGECAGGVVKVTDKILYYGVLEDVYINVLRGEEMRDMVKMDYQIMRAYNYAKSEIDKNPEKGREFEEVWCKKLRNNPDIKDDNGEKVGWGSFNGERAASKFWQTGKVELKTGDIILMISDGAVQLFTDHMLSEKTDEIIFRKGDNKGTDAHQKLSEYISILLESDESEVDKDSLTSEKTILRALWKYPALKK
jgi:hypothetical protein